MNLTHFPLSFPQCRTAVRVKRAVCEMRRVRANAWPPHKAILAKSVGASRRTARYRKKGVNAFPKLQCFAGNRPAENARGYLIKFLENKGLSESAFGGRAVGRIARGKTRRRNADDDPAGRPSVSLVFTVLLGPVSRLMGARFATTIFRPESSSCRLWPV